MIGSTKESFIKKYIKHTSQTITARKIRVELEGMSKWHKIIGSTPPPWFDVDALNYEIFIAREKTPRTKPDLEKKIYLEEIQK